MDGSSYCLIQIETRGREISGNLGLVLPDFYYKHLSDPDKVYPRIEYRILLLKA